MRNYIFEFEQEQALKLDLNLKDLLLLDYMYKFFNSDQIKKHLKDEKFYCRLTYNKVLSDLPILHIKERQLRNMIIKLEDKGILERLSELKNQMHLYVDWSLLFGNQFPYNQKHSEANFLDVGNNVPTIDIENNNKIKITIENACVKELDLELFNRKFHELLKAQVSSISYSLFLCDCKAIETHEDGITFAVKWKEHLEKHFMEKFIQIVKEALKYFI